MSDEFDWDAVKDDLVVDPARKVAVYFNRDGDVVIRQEDNDYFGEDPFIIIPFREVPRLIAKLNALIKAS